MKHPSDAPHGSLLVVTLWLMVILSMLAVAVARSLSAEVRLATYRLARERARMLARSGVNLALQRLAHDQQEPDGATYDWLGDEWAWPAGPDATEDPTTWVVQIPLGDAGAGMGSTAGLIGRLAIHITDEERRLPLNPDTKGGALTSAIVTRLTTSGIPGPVVTAMLDYQSGNDEGVDTSVDPPYTPKNAPLQTLAELWDIPAVRRLPDAEAESVWKTLDSLMTFFTDGSINLNTADATTLAAALELGVPGQGASLAQDVVRFHWDPQGGNDPGSGIRFTSLNPVTTLPGAIDTFARADDLRRAVGGAAGSVLTVESHVFRIAVDGALLPSGAVAGKPLATCHIEAVVRRDASEQPLRFVGPRQFQMLAWSER